MVSRKKTTITRVQLVAAAGRLSGLQRSVSDDLGSQLIGLISEAVLRDEPVLLSGFGKFIVVEQATRLGRTVPAGLDARVGARKVLVFKPSLGLLDKLNPSAPVSAQSPTVTARGASWL
jgi:nucleoid DNA-binding protein